MHIGLLECDNVVGRFPGIEGGYREMFAALLAPHVPALRFSYYAAHDGELPAAPDACDAWLCSGSQFSVYDPLEWVGALARFMREVQAARTPFVGICFGHQMLAQALGGEVTRAAYGWGVGVQPMAIRRQEPWMQPPLESCRLQYMHQDQVVRLPPGALVLAESAHCEVAMFRVGETMLGIEGHPEFTPQYSRTLIRHRAERIGAERTQAALASVALPNDGQVVGGWIGRFLQLPGITPAGSSAQ
jgi:GMP synthase-like glutamine amidotransferase